MNALFSLGLLLAPPALVVAADEDLVVLRSELRDTLVELAALCQKEKLYLQRDGMYELVLEVDPDHQQARKVLGYRRGKSGWERGNYRPPRDRGGDEALQSLQDERSRRASDFAGRLAPFFAELDLATRLVEIQPYLLLDPENAELNRLIDRVQDDEGRWRDPGELAAELRRKEIQDLVWEALERVPDFEDWDLTSPLSDVSVDWTAAYRTERVRITGTGRNSELRRATEVAHALEDFLVALLPMAPESAWGSRAKIRARKTHLHPRYRKFDVVLLDGRGGIPALLEGWTELSGEDRELFPQLSTAWLDQENTLGVWVEDEAERLDAMTRQLVGAYLRDTFGLSTRHGWAWEGFGLYLTHLVVGTRMTFFVRPSEYVESADANLDQRLLRPEADWLAELQKEVEDGRRPRLGFVIGKDVNSLEVRDLLLSNALAIYLTEETPEILTGLLSELGEGKTSLQALEQATGKKIPTLEQELYAWLARRVQ